MIQTVIVVISQCWLTALVMKWLACSPRVMQIVGSSQTKDHKIGICCFYVRDDMSIH